MKVTVYTTSTCTFSKAEKEYLTQKGLVFEEKNLETNRDYLTEMLAVSNNFQGTPVTKIEKDDGQSVVLKGFTREELDQVLGPPVQTQQPNEPTSPTPPPAQPPTPEPLKQPEIPPSPTQPPQPEPPTTPAPQPQQPSTETPTPSPVTEPAASSHDNALDAILKDLQKKANEAYSTQGPGPQEPAKPANDQPIQPPAPTTPTTPSEPTTPATPVQTPPSTPQTPPAVPDFPK